MDIGDYKVRLTNSYISYNPGGTTVDEHLPDVIRTISVEDYMLGDVNGDKQISLADAIMILYRSFGVTQSGFIEKAADVTKDGNISLADAIEVLYKSFGVNVNWVKQRFDLIIEPD